MKYYFAYGSNMDESQMRERCPESQLVGPALLKDHRVAFTIFSPRRKCGCADVVPSPGQTAPGLLYKVSERDIENLDHYENVADNIYRQIEVQVVTNDGTTIPCVAYAVVHKEDGLRPSRAYLGIMQDAANKFSFPEEYRRFLERVLTMD